MGIGQTDAFSLGILYFAGRYGGYRLLNGTILVVFPFLLGLFLEAFFARKVLQKNGGHILSGLGENECIPVRGVRAKKGRNKARRERAGIMRISDTALTKSTKGIAMRKSLLFAAAVAAAVVLSGVRIYASDAFDIFGYAATTYLQYDNTAGYDANHFPVITAVGSAPSTYDGHGFYAYTAFAQDQTGSLVLYITASNLTNMTHTYGQTLAPGMGINVAASYQPYHQMPEIGFYTTVSSGHYFQVTSTGNALPTPPVTTVSHVNVPVLPQDSDGYYMEILNATISGGTGAYMSVFPTYTQATVSTESYTITDNTGSMTMFDWVTSYSTCAALGGTAVPTGPVNVYGFISYNTGGPAEFTPLLIVPEPSTIVLAGLGLAGLLAIRRRRS